MTMLLRLALFRASAPSVCAAGRAGATAVAMTPPDPAAAPAGAEQDFPSALMTQVLVVQLHFPKDKDWPVPQEDLAGVDPKGTAWASEAKARIAETIELCML